MALKIIDECIACDACVAICPNQAIAEGVPVYEIDPDRCTECVGAFDVPQCRTVCPIDDCIIDDPDRIESAEDLAAKYRALHPDDIAPQ